jgi:hypothetical protein
LLVVAILIARVAFNVLLMILAGALISVYFHGLRRYDRAENQMEPQDLYEHIGCWLVPDPVHPTVWVMGTTIQGQIAILSESLPQTINNFKAKLGEGPIGAKILEYFGSDNTDKLFATAQSFFSTSFGVLGNIYIIMFLGIFFTTSPSLYKDGIIKLFP